MSVKYYFPTQTFHYTKLFREITVSATKHLRCTNMHYISVTEHESSREVSCKVVNLPVSDLSLLEEHFRNLQIVTYCLPNNIFEVDVHGVQLLTKLSDILYRVVGQSMTMEQTVIGGGTVKVQKIVWTLAKE